MIIGLTGTYCAGKNHVAAILEKRGLSVLDVDKLGYQVLEEKKDAIFSQFGSDLQKTDGSLNRRLLGERVFGKPEKLSLLESIIHPEANRLTDEWIKEREKAGEKAFIVNAALLHRSSVFHRLDRIILVTAPFLVRLLRARRRDRLAWPEILKRFASQKNFNTQYLSKKAEIYRIENSGSAGFGGSKLERRINKFIEGIFPGS
jgi:dephospho-CoA kinase